MTKKQSEPVPHSWDLEHWPQSVFPNTPGKARGVVRAHQNDLLRAGALLRVGRAIVILGARYSAWLENQSVNVPGFDIAPNRIRSSDLDEKLAP